MQGVSPVLPEYECKGAEKRKNAAVYKAFYIFLLEIKQAWEPAE